MTRGRGLEGLESRACTKRTAAVRSWCVVVMFGVNTSCCSLLVGVGVGVRCARHRNPNRICAAAVARRGTWGACVRPARQQQLPGRAREPRGCWEHAVERARGAAPRATSSNYCIQAIPYHTSAIATQHTRVCYLSEFALGVYTASSHPQQPQRAKRGEIRADLFLTCFFSQ